MLRRVNDGWGGTLGGIHDGFVIGGCRREAFVTYSPRDGFAVDGG